MNTISLLAIRLRLISGVLASLLCAMLTVVPVSVTNAANLLASSSTPTITFDDTDEAGLEWQLGATGLPAFPHRVFLDDLASGTRIFDIAGSPGALHTLTVGAPTGNVGLADNTVFIDRVNVGVTIGAAAPSTGGLNVVTGAPRIRLQPSSGGTPFLIGLLNSFTHTFAIINTPPGDDTTPFQIEEFSPNDSLVIKGTTGDIGLGTNAPSSALHVLRADGSARILAQEINPLIQPRSMFELINNGPIGFNMTNTDTFQTWRFAGQTTGFRVSLDGTGGPEMEVGNAGTLAVGPGGASNLFLDASGNLTITGSLSQSSDANAKEGFSKVDGQSILARLEVLPITQWRYKQDAIQSPHLGPTAQDFHSAFGLGADEKHIAPLDAASVALVGVKELNQTLQQEIRTQEAEIAKRDTTITEQQSEIAGLKERLAALEEMVSRIVAHQTTQTAQR